MNESEEITRTPAALSILQASRSSRLQQLFNCIYAMFQSNFINWILRKYNNNICKDKLWEDAKDAFQNGLMVFYLKSRQKGFTIRASLKTVVYWFAFLQFLAARKKEKMVYGIEAFDKYFDKFFENDLLEIERQSLLNKQENDLLDAISKLSGKQREILMLKFFNKMRSSEIAEKLDISVGNVDNTSTKAYKELRRLMQEHTEVKINENGIK